MDISKLYEYVTKLKRTKRAGWVRENISDSESVADHSFGLAILVMFVADSLHLNTEKMLKMALLHDLSESITGDIVTHRGGVLLTREIKDKTKKEEKAMEQIFLSLEYPQEYILLWEELRERKTKEARIIEDLDKLEMALQAYEYERETKKNLQEFFDDAEVLIKTEVVQALFTALLLHRKKK